jgi:D-3-phosphoglycerate dehydrogenase / 2-oxoglutarate reductase
VIVAMVSRDPGELPAWVEEGIAAAGITLLCRRCPDPESLVAFAGEADVLWFCGPNPCITPEALPRLPKCRAVFRSGSGLDSIPVAAAQALGIAVHNTPESIAESVAEHAVALLLALVRQVTVQDRRVRAGQWAGSEPQQRWHLSRRCLGLVGYGGIARRVERMLAGFDLRVLHHDPFSPRSTPLPDLLREADAVSLHCPLTRETRHLIGATELALMKPGALLVNTARGAVVDEAALVEALRANRIGGAALDVLEQEPPAPDNPLLALDNVILSPHIAAFSADFERNFWQASIDKLNTLCSTSSSPSG